MSKRISYRKLFLCFFTFIGSVAVALESELWDDSDLEKQENFHSPLPFTYIDPKDLPDDFTWGDIGGRSFLTKSLNQHIPQYCGSCWAHAALSSLADRIKINRKAQGTDINLSIQFILNCGSEAGSCHGGSVLRTYKFIKENSGYVPYDTCQPYLACSSESVGGFCKNVDTTCNAFNTCKTCMHGSNSCSAIKHFPNATVAEYGFIENNVEAIQAEIFARGPVAAGLWGKSLSDYEKGIFDDVDSPRNSTHAVSIVGWGTDETGRKYWIVRNSWGEYWGEMGFFRILMGKNVLGIESRVTWSTPGPYTVVNYPCFEDGGNCKEEEVYVDPSSNLGQIKRRLSKYKNPTTK